jgi:soluble lytic murein transglycosylase-like protein
MSITPIGNSNYAGSATGTEQRLSNAATDFEAIFLKQLMQFAQMDLGDGVAGDTYQDWFNAALSDQLAQRQPLGIAAGIIEQLQQDHSTGLPDSFELHEMIRDTSQRHGLSEQLLNAVIQVESGGDPHAVSQAGARGLMQLMPQTATMLGVSDSFDARMNLDGGARYLSSLLDRYDGDLDRALGAYNAGPGAVDRYNGVPPYPETQRYVEKVRQLISTSEEQ